MDKNIIQLLDHAEISHIWPFHIWPLVNTNKKAGTKKHVDQIKIKKVGFDTSPSSCQPWVFSFEGTLGHTKIHCVFVQWCDTVLYLVRSHHTGFQFHGIFPSTNFQLVRPTQRMSSDRLQSGTRSSRVNRIYPPKTNHKSGCSRFHRGFSCRFVSEPPGYTPVNIQKAI